MSKPLYGFSYVIIVLSCLIAVPQSVLSEELLQLEHALELAYQQNPRMVQARHAIDGAKGEHLSAKSWRDPQFEAEIGGLKKNDAGSRDARVGSYSVNQSFDPPGVRYLNSRIAHNGVTIQEESLKEIWAKVYAEVRNAYAQLILQKKELELRESNLKSMRQFFSDVQVRYQGGQALKTQVHRANIEMLNAESEYFDTKHLLDVTKARINLLLGRDLHDAFEIKEELQEERLLVDMEHLTEIALANRPDIRMQQASLDSANKQVMRERLNLLPAYSLGFKVTDEDYENDYAALIKLSFPLWDLNRGDIKRAKAERESAKAELDILERQTAFEVHEAYEHLLLTVKQLDLFKQSFAEANEMFRLARLHYSEGEIGFLDYLDQLLASMDSRMRYYQGLFELNQRINALEQTVYSSLREDGFLK